MAYEDLTPSNRFELALSGDMTAEEASNRIEKILAGADIEPSNRLEYFLKLRVSGGGGGGSDSDFELLKTYAPETPTRSIIVDFTEFSGYDIYVVVEDITLNAEDWIYYNHDTTETSGGWYDSKAISHKGIAAIKLKASSGGDVQSSLRSGSTLLALTSSDWSNVILFAYNAANAIQPGSSVKLYGLKIYS